MMQILDLIDIYLDAAVVFFTFIQIGSGHTVHLLWFYVVIELKIAPVRLLEPYRFISSI